MESALVGGDLLATLGGPVVPMTSQAVELDRGEFAGAARHNGRCGSYCL